MSYFGKKLLHLVTVLLAVTALTFLMVNLLPGDVAYEIAGQQAAPGVVEAIREELGLNKNILLRYVDWLVNVAKGDLGESFRTGEPVTKMILSRLPVTIELLIISQIFVLIMAIPAGIISACRERTVIDQSLSSTAFALISIPNFVLALILIFVFALRLKWLPATGYTSLSHGLWANLRTFILPGLSIALVEWVPLMRVLRSDMIATLQEDFILMAKAKGLPTWKIIFRHALKPSLFTLITLLGIQIGYLFGGALVIETIFALPGIGRLLVSAVFARDFIVVQGCVLFIALAYVIINFLVDILYSLLDPRIRTEKSIA